MYTHSGRAKNVLLENHLDVTTVTEYFSNHNNITSCLKYYFLCSKTFVHVCLTVVCVYSPLPPLKSEGPSSLFFLVGGGEGWCTEAIQQQFQQKF